MQRTLLYMLLLAFIAFVTAEPACCTSTDLPQQATVIQTLNYGGYTYVETTNEKGAIVWLCFPEDKVAEGDKIEYRETSSSITNFQSEALNKTFEKIFFVPGVGVVKHSRQVSQDNFMASANSPSLNYLKSISGQYGDIITRCENKGRSSKPNLDYWEEIGTEVGIMEKLKQTGIEIEDLKQMVACVVGFSLREHNIHSDGDDKTNDTIKLYTISLEDSLRRESCAEALQQLKNARTTFEAYYADNNRYPTTIKASGFIVTKGVSLKGVVLKPQIHELSSTHESCNVSYYSGSKVREIREKVKKGFPKSPMYTKTDTELFRMLKELRRQNNDLDELQ